MAGPRTLIDALFFYPFIDPNGNEAVKILYRKLDGTCIDPGVGFELHGSNGLRFAHGNAAGDAGDVFEVTSNSQTITTPQGNSRIVIREA